MTEKLPAITPEELRDMAATLDLIVYRMSRMPLMEPEDRRACRACAGFLRDIAANGGIPEQMRVSKGGAP